MRADAEQRSRGAVWATTNDPRKTRIGGLSPALQHRRASAALQRAARRHVAGRPAPRAPGLRRPLPHDAARYDERHLVRPGITGWSHVHMNRNVDTSAAGERLELRPAIPPKLVAVSRRRRSLSDALRVSFPSSGMSARARAAHSAVDARLRRRTAHRRAASRICPRRQRRRRAADDLRAAGRASRRALPFPIFHAGRKGRKDRLSSSGIWCAKSGATSRYRPHAHARGQVLGTDRRNHGRRPPHRPHRTQSVRFPPYARSNAPPIGCCTGDLARRDVFQRSGPAPEQLERLPMRKLVVIPNGLVICRTGRGPPARARSGSASPETSSRSCRSAAWSTKRTTSWRCARFGMLEPANPARGPFCFLPAPARTK